MRTLPAELVEKIAVYKLWLWDGDQLRISKEVKKSETMVSLVLNGKAFSKNIIEAARKRAIENAAKHGVEIP